MNTFPSTVQSSLGRTFHLAQQIGKGGEGAIYTTREQSDIALKLYWPNKAQNRRDKIAAMASAQWHKSNSFVAFPIDILFAPNGTFIGFVMRKIDGSKPVHMLYSPASRKVEFTQANYKFLVRVAANISRAVATVHACGCVIGDINHSGFLISNKATSVIIDSDSFQVVASSNKYLCQVGTPEYTPPELQGARFDRIVRTTNHDNFGLAVLVFQVLFMGRHPFSGRYQGSGDMPLERAIGEYRFAYSAQSSLTKMQPPPGAPLLADFPPDIGQAFEKAFGRSGKSLRSSAAEWVSLLENLEKSLVTCTADNSHQHVQGKPCPWCRMEQTNPGFIAFNSIVTSAPIPIQVDISQIAAIIGAIRDPGPVPDIQTAIVVQSNTSASSPSAALMSTLRFRAYLGVGASAAGAILISFGGFATLPGLAALGIGLAANVLIPRELKGLRQARSQAETSWRGVQDAWMKQPGNKQFLQIKTELNQLVQTLSDLPNEERRQIQGLEQKKREAQLRRHLDRFLIADAKIKKIGSGRKAVLASFGVQTAADVDAQRISAIQGFGPALVAELMTWHQNVAKRFIFNASEPVNQNELLALKSRLANRKWELDKTIRVTVSNLQQASIASVNHRTKLTGIANQAFVARRQAESDECAATGPLHKASKFISLCCAGLAAIGLMRIDRPIATNAFRDGPKVSEAPFSTGTASTSKNAVPFAKQEPSPAAPPTPHSNDMASVPPNGGQSPLTSGMPPNSNTVTPGPMPAEPTPSSRFDPPKTIAPEQQRPEPPRTAQDVPTSSEMQRQLSEKDGATEVQQRLIKLGYLSGDADGKWGPQSKRALLEFKQRAHLEKNDYWDAQTESALFNESAPRAIRPVLFIGGWSPDPNQCGNPGDPAPLRITADRAEVRWCCLPVQFGPPGRQQKLAHRSQLLIRRECTHRACAANRDWTEFAVDK